MSFEDFGFRKEIISAISKCGYADPTPVQAEAIPPVLEGRDVVALAQTGTGKTASFILPMLEMLSVGRARARMPRSLVLIPTRELASQVADNFDNYGANLRLSKALLTGGSAMGDQMKLLDRGVDVLIATPGRLLDLFDRGHILLSDIKILVIDEADRMLDMGFIPDIDKIVSRIPAVRQTLLFSATMPDEIQRLSRNYMSNPVQVSVAPRSSTADTVKQFVIHTDYRRKRSALMHILSSEDIRNSFVFLNRKRDVDQLCKWLSSKGFLAAAMHGDMQQSERNKTLAKFKEGEVKYLVCSDVAARGLDVEAISHVINYDVPTYAEDYVHRIGRTGRAGMDGRAWTLVSGEDDEKFLSAIEKLIGKKLERCEIPEGKNNSASGRRDSSKKREYSQNKDKKPVSARRVAGKRKGSSEDLIDEGENVVGFGDDLPDFFK